MTRDVNLDLNLSSNEFKSYYFLKEELVQFCRKYDLQTSGSKSELTERISHFLDTGEKLHKKREFKLSNNNNELIELTTVIGPNYRSSENVRSFFKKEIGDNFKFKVAFQKWMKSNPTKTYSDAIDAYYRIIEDKKTNKTKIDSQFEYNTYIRDFFHNNKDKSYSLKDAIKCWNYKKSKKGHNKYEKDDLIALNED